MIKKQNLKYEEHANRHRKYVKSKVRDLVGIHLRKDRFPQGKHGKLKPHVDGPFKIIEKIGKNAYKLELSTGYNISLTFNVKDLRLNLEGESIEDLRTSLCFQLWGINTKVLA